MNTASQTFHTPNAGLIKRLAAMVYDGFILFAISIGYGALVLFIKVQALGMTLAEGEKAQMGILGFLGWVLLLIFFYCFFWRRFGQTVGMKAWRLKLISETGESPSLLQCLQRCGYATCSFAFLGLGYLWLLIDSNNNTLHDKLSKTQVKQLPKGL